MPSRYKKRPGSYGAEFSEAQCAAKVWPNDRDPRPHQCQRKPWKDGWCKQHHPDEEKERNRKRDEKYRAEIAASTERYNRPAKLIEAINAMVKWDNGVPHYRGRHGVAVDMPSKAVTAVKRVRKYLVRVPSGSIEE